MRVLGLQCKTSGLIKVRMGETKMAVLVPSHGLNFQLKSCTGSLEKYKKRVADWTDFV